MLIPLSIVKGPKQEMFRPRLHRLLHHLAGVLCLMFVDPGPPLHQADVDAGLRAWCERNP
jgi:hypothetical protein